MPMSHSIRKTGCICRWSGTQARERLQFLTKHARLGQSMGEGSDRAVGHLEMECMHMEIANIRTDHQETQFEVLSLRSGSPK